MARPKKSKVTEIPAQPKQETQEETTQRLFNELNQFANPLYNWLISNFDENTSIVIKKGKVVVWHDMMVMNIVDEVKEDGSKDEK